MTEYGALVTLSRTVWIASSIAAVVIAIIRRWKQRRTVWPVFAVWVGVVTIYTIGLRAYMASKKPGHWCRNELIDNLRQIDAGKEQPPQNKVLENIGTNALNFQH